MDYRPYTFSSSFVFQKNVITRQVSIKRNRVPTPLLTSLVSAHGYDVWERVRVT